MYDISVDLWEWKRVPMPPVASIIQRSSVPFKSQLRCVRKNSHCGVRLIYIPILTLSLKSFVAISPGTQDHLETSFAKLEAKLDEASSLSSIPGEVSKCSILTSQLV